MSLDSVVEFFAANPVATALATSLFFTYMVYTDRNVGEGINNPFVQMFVRDLKFFNKLALVISVAFSIIFAVKAIFFE